jgi:hypothetical protein
MRKNCGPGSSVGIATSYGLDGPGMESSSEPFVYGRWSVTNTHTTKAQRRQALSSICARQTKWHKAPYTTLKTQPRNARDSNFRELTDGGGKSHPRHNLGADSHLRNIQSNQMELDMLDTDHQHHTYTRRYVKAQKILCNYILPTGKWTSHSPSM